MTNYCQKDCYVCACKNRHEKFVKPVYSKRRGLLQKTRKENLLKVVEKYIYKRIYNIYIKINLKPGIIAFLLYYFNK